MLAAFDATLIPFAAYMFGVMLIAVAAHRYQTKNEEARKNFEEEYYVGGRSFGAWVLAMSWVATLASGGTFLGYPSYVFSYGWSMALWVSGSTVAAIVGLGIVGKRINRIARQTGALTLVDLLRDRYASTSLGLVYGAVIVAVTTVYNIAQFVAGARILEFILETNFQTSLLIFAGTVVAYTTIGGFRAVAWTDTMQGIVMIVGIVILVPLSLNAVGGLDKATRNLMNREDHMASARNLKADKHAYLYLPGPQKIPKQIEPKKEGQPSESVPWLPIGVGISLFMLRSIGSIVMPTTVPRMLAFKDTKSLRRALYLLAPYFLLMYGSSLIIMNCAYSMDLGLGLGESDKALPAVAQKVAPPWLAGILIAAPFAAVMSTVDSALLVVSATIVRDFLQRTIWPSMSESSTKRLSYSVTAGVGLVVLVMAWNIEPTFLQPLVIHYVGASSSAFLWPSLTTLFWKRATATGTIAGLAGGIVVYAVFAIARPLSHVVALHPFVYGVAASGILCILGSLATQPQDPNRIALYFGREPENADPQD